MKLADDSSTMLKLAVTSSPENLASGPGTEHFPTLVAQLLSRIYTWARETSAIRQIGVLTLWSVVPPKDPRTPKQLKWPKNDSKVTLGGRRPSNPKKGEKWLKRVKSDRKPFFCHFWPFFGSLGRRPPESLLSHFWVTLIVLAFWGL